MDSRPAAANASPPLPDAPSTRQTGHALPSVERLLAGHPRLLAATRDTLAAAGRDGVEHVHLEPVGRHDASSGETGWRLRRRHDDGLEDRRLASDEALAEALCRLADHGEAFTIGLGGEPRLIGLRTLPAFGGDTFLLTLFGGAFSPPSLDALGLDPADLRAVRTLLARRSGWLAVGAAGPLDGARLVRAIAQEVVSPDRAVICLDRLPHPPIAGVVQLDAARAVDETLALDSDVVLLASDPPAGEALLGELATRALGDFLVVRASVARRPSDILRELVAGGRSEAWLALALPAVLMRHRVRLLCANCRVRVAHDDEASHRLGLRLAPRVHDVSAWLERSLAVRYRAGPGCERCDGRGHAGARDLTTIATSDEPVRQALREGDLDTACSRLDRTVTLARRLGAMVAGGEVAVSEADRHLAARY